MNISMEEKAGILTRALPYIQKYNGKILVVKYGGNAMVSEELKESVMSDIILLSTIGIKVVLVHGGGPEITGMLNKIGKKSEFVNGNSGCCSDGSRRQDKQEPCQSALCKRRKSNRSERFGRRND